MEKNTVQLSGFSAVERLDAMVAVNKFVEKVKRHLGDFDELLVNKKDVHKQGIHGLIEINANLIIGSARHHGHSEEHIIKDALDAALLSVENSCMKKK